MDKSNLLNTGEQTLYTMLCKAAPNLTVFSQVSMSQIFELDKQKNAQLNEIGKCSVDFLLCRKNTSIVIAIELNGPDHENEDRKEKDEKKRMALETAGIPLVIFTYEDLENTSKLSPHLAINVMNRRKFEEERKNAICVKCQSPVKANVFHFCKSNAARFKNEIACKNCQNKHYPYQ